MLLVFASLARAAIPAIYAQPEPADIAAAFTAYAKGQGRTGPATEIHCQPLADGLALCFRYREGDHFRYVTQSEVVSWHADDAALVAAAKATPLDDARFERTAIPDTPDGVYWVSRKGDGLDGAVLLDPKRLERLAGGPVVVAVPTAGTLLFWRPGSGDADRILAVGARRMADASDHPVSDRLYRWDGTAWRVWGETVPKDAPGSGSGSGTR